MIETLVAPMMGAMCKREIERETPSAIEVTPAMIAAGYEELWAINLVDGDRATNEEVLRDIFLAMLSAAPKPSR